MSNMSDTKVVVQGQLDTPNGLAVDWIANNLYWSDNEFKVMKCILTVMNDVNFGALCFMSNFIIILQVIEVARLDGSSRKTLLTKLTEPRAIAVFPAKG